MIKNRYGKIKSTTLRYPYVDKHQKPKLNIKIGLDSTLIRKVGSKSCFRSILMSRFREVIFKMFGQTNKQCCRP